MSRRQLRPIITRFIKQVVTRQMIVVFSEMRLLVWGLVGDSVVAAKKGLGEWRKHFRAHEYGNDAS